MRERSVSADDVVLDESVECGASSYRIARVYFESQINRACLKRFVLMHTRDWKYRFLYEFFSCEKGLKAFAERLTRCLMSSHILCIQMCYISFRKIHLYRLSGGEGPGAVGDELEDGGVAELLVGGEGPGNVEGTKALLEAGVDKETLDNTGYYPIHWATYPKSVDSLKLLVEAGVNVNSRDKNNMTALGYTAKYNNVEGCKILLAAGADKEAVDQWGYHPIHWATYGDTLDILKLLVQVGVDLNARANDGKTPLHWTTGQYDNANGTRVLLAAGANATLLDDAGDAPVHVAVHTPSPRALAALLEAGGAAARDARDARGRAALHVAAARGDVAATRALLAAGADFRARDVEGRVPLDLVAAGGANEAALRRMFEEAAAATAPTTSDKESAT